MLFILYYLPVGRKNAILQRRWRNAVLLLFSVGFYACTVIFDGKDKPGIAFECAQSAFARFGGSVAIFCPFFAYFPLFSDRIASRGEIPPFLREMRGIFSEIFMLLYKDFIYSIHLSRILSNDF